MAPGSNSPCPSVLLSLSERTFMSLSIIAFDCVPFDSLSRIGLSEFIGVSEKSVIMSRLRCACLVIVYSGPLS